MSDKPELKDVEQKVLYRETVEDQIKASEQIIADLQSTLVRVQKDLEQNIGVLNHAKFLLQKFALPKRPEEPKKPNLEVK